MSFGSHDAESLCSKKRVIKFSLYLKFSRGSCWPAFYGQMAKAGAFLKLRASNSNPKNLYPSILFSIPFVFFFFFFQGNHLTLTLA